MRQARRQVRRWAACALAGVFVGLPAGAADQIQVETAPPPVPFLQPFPAGTGNAATIDGVLEPSAVEPIGDGRLLLVADDKTNGLVVVEAATGQRVGAPLPGAAFPLAEAKWEAMARDDENHFYLIGSHSGRPDQLGAHSYLFRFRLKGGGADGAPLAIDKTSVTRFDVATALNKEGLYNLQDPTKHRVKIEGLTVRTLREGAPGRVTRRELVVGLREPDDPITAYAAELPGAGRNPAPLALRRLFTFPGGTREKVRSQLASLDYVPAWKGFLVVTSSEDADNNYHGNTLWFVPDAQLSPSRPAAAQQVWLFGAGIKAEGLCVLPGIAGTSPGLLRVGLVYDNDPARTKKASLLQVVTLARWPD